LIFLPGFSTAGKVTDLSGRGVGMDVVKDTVKKLNGEIEINTRSGKGTCFIIKLPLTLAIINVLMVEAGGNFFAIPLSSIRETVKILQDEIKYILDKKVIVLRERLVGILDLRELLGLAMQKSSQKRLSIVVVEVEGKETGFVVDELHTQQEIVIKPLEGVVADIPGVAGATILGDGRIVPILDPVELVRLQEGKILFQKRKS
ncbi:chemotaxis protein CheW, partial [Candidatus Aerophobetes bacterium]|nr:chemotaxis protein CheW [Candidatus Aerophobetes bacterium]